MRSEQTSFGSFPASYLCFYTWNCFFLFMWTSEESQIGGVFQSHQTVLQIMVVHFGILPCSVLYIRYIYVYVLSELYSDV